MKTMLTFVLCLWGAVGLWATQQSRDVLLYKGKEYRLNTEPLRPFIEKHPDKDPRNFEFSWNKDEETPVIDENGVTNGWRFSSRTSTWRSNLVRGYLATFEVKDEQLFLKDIKVPRSEIIFLWGAMDEIFPDITELKATWLTGMVEVAYGDVIKTNIAMWYAIHDSYLLLEIREGNVVKEYRLTRGEYEAFKKKRYDALKEYERDVFEKRRHELYKKSAPLREKKEDEEDFVEPTKDERALYMFEQEVKILNNRQENL